MRIDVYVHFEGIFEVRSILDSMNTKLDLILRKENIIMSDLTDALDKAEANAKADSDAEDAVVALLTTLSAQIAALKAGGTDPATVARITALSDALKARAAQLGAAVVANTPAE